MADASHQLTKGRQALRASLSGFQVGTFPTIRNTLTDSALTSLSSAGAPFAGGDYTGANDFYILALGAYGTQYDNYAGSIAIRVSSKCKADFNESGTLQVQDIFDFLSAWFAGC